MSFYFLNLVIFFAYADNFSGGVIMRIDQDLMSYKRITHYQKQFKEFEEVIRDKIKETPKSKQIYESLKSS